MLMTPDNRARITTQVVPWVAGAAAEAVSVTYATSAPRRARSDPRQAVLTTRCADRIRNPVAPASAIPHSGGPRAGAMRGGDVASPSCARISRTAIASLMKAMMHISAPHRRK